ncbi:MAG: 3-methyl-2-oxobutanoate hydroxymethyltransferase [Phycisphaerales bacterium]|nr:3-methyl-2-oxobutanoate hydroxymethyltransferase [Phycisphaerales bacterium]
MGSSSGNSNTPQGLEKPVTLRTIRRMVESGDPFAALTCYDATSARWFQQAGVPVLLVGDTAAEMILGLPGTIHAPLDFMLTITAAVRRGAPNCLLMGDMPFLSYQVDEAEAIRNAGRFMVEGQADCVKLEVDGTFSGLVSQMNRAGIPVIAHIGSRPQQVKHDGGYRSFGRTAAEASRLIEDARRLEEAGATMLLIEAVPSEVTQAIVDCTSIPVIGCGAGTACHGQVVVTQDLMGLTPWQPAFASPLVDMGAEFVALGQKWIDRVKTGNLGEHPYKMAPGETLGDSGEVARRAPQQSH